MRIFFKTLLAVFILGFIYLLSASSSFASAPTVAGHTNGSTSTSGNSVSLTSWTPSSSDVIILKVSLKGSQTVSSVSGNGAAWSKVLGASSTNPSGSMETWLGTSPDGNAGQITVTLSGNTNGIAAIAVRVSGASTSLDATNVVKSNGQNASVSLTTSGNDRLLIGTLFTDRSSISYTTQSGETQEDTVAGGSGPGVFQTFRKRGILGR